MRTYFECELKNVYIGGVLVENAKIVKNIRNTTDNVEPIMNEIEVSEKNKGIYIMGMRYNEETDEFENVDVVTEPTQLDRIEEGTTKLLADIQSQAIDEYTMQLLEEGVL